MSGEKIDTLSFLILLNIVPLVPHYDLTNFYIFFRAKICFGFALIEWIFLPALTFTILLKIVPLSLEALQI